MEKKAIVFIDYNGTFDDVENGKGKILSSGLKKLMEQFDGNLEIAVITTSPCPPYEQSIKSDLACTLTFFPTFVREKFKYLIEKNCKLISKISFDENYVIFSNAKELCNFGETKKDAVEQFLKIYDKDCQVSTCIFAGDSQTRDLIMIEADVGNRDKFMILASRKVLKEDVYPNCPRYKLSLTLNSPAGNDILAKVGLKNTKCLIIKSSNNSYGVGKGLEAVSSLIEERERIL